MPDSEDSEFPREVNLLLLADAKINRKVSKEENFYDIFKDNKNNEHF